MKLFNIGTGEVLETAGLTPSGDGKEKGRVLFDAAIGGEVDQEDIIMKRSQTIKEE